VSNAQWAEFFMGYEKKQCLAVSICEEKKTLLRKIRCTFLATCNLKRKYTLPQKLKD